jgi:hypothetical protein
MLARLPPEKREEMKEMYHKMKQEQSDHLKIDIKEDDIDNVTPEQMMMGMTGGSTTFPSGTTSNSWSGIGACPIMHGHSGG